MNWNGSGVRWRLYDAELHQLVGPVESRAAANKRLASWTKGKRDPITNWLRFKVFPIPISLNNPKKVHAYWNWPKAYVKHFKKTPKPSEEIDVRVM